MDLPPISKKQQEIITLIYKFRFINSIQIQHYLKHKDRMRINLWLKDLVEKEYLKRIYSNTIGDNTKPAIYYCGINTIRYVKKSVDTSGRYVKNLYRDNERSQDFMIEQMFVFDVYLDLLNKSIEGETEYHIEAAADVTSNPIYSFMEDLSPQLIISKTSGGAEKNYIFQLLASNMPKYTIRKKIKNYIELFYSNEWEENTGKSFPTILFACESKALLIFAKKTAYKLLSDYQDPEDLELWFGLYEDIREYGVDGEIWETVV